MLQIHAPPACCSGARMAAIGGAYLSIAQLGNFVEDMVSGRGFISIACVVYGRWNPLGVMTACLFFGVIDASQIRLQSIFSGVPYQFFVILPYALAIGALALFFSTVANAKRTGATVYP